VPVLRYLASLLAEASFEEERPGVLGGTTIVRREPIGVVGGIVPWNYPQTLASFKYGPALAAGCTIVLKPSPETVLDAFLFAEAVADAGIPPGVINIVPGGREVGAYLVQHPDVDKVAFTGSTAAGRRIAETCGRLLRPVTLELAASRPRSSSTTPTLTWPRSATTCSRPLCSTTGRPATSAPGSSPPAHVTTKSSTPWARSPRR
jgi:acyl-CoA reductase-like NAD-dependent aldehyde dehydrogenase